MTSPEDKQSDVEVSQKEDDDAVDPIKNSIGDFGKWQLFTCLALAVCKIPVAWHQLGIVFLAAPVGFNCTEAGGKKPHLSFLDEFYNYSTNLESDDQCYKNGKECTKWEYDNGTFTSTIITTWDLVCSRKDLADLAQTIFMAGVLAGSLIFGMAADKWGRKYPLLMTVIIQIVTGIATALIDDYIVFLVLRFLDAAATGGEMVVSFVICMELLSKKWRAIVSTLYHVPFFLGHTLLPAIAYFLRDWREYQLAISIPPVLLLSYIWIVPESPRWLIMKNRKEEAVSILQKGAKINKLPRPEMDVIDRACSKDDKPIAKGSILDLFTSSVLRVRTVCILFNWISCGLGFFGLAQYMSKIEGDIFLNVTISGLMELPGSIVCIYLMEKLGRRMTLRIANIIGGLACIAIIAVPADADPMITVVLAALGVVGMSICFPTLYMYSGELFPTVVRNVAVGTASMCARIGSMVAPFITSLDGFLPPLIFGLFPLIGAVLTLFLPETKGCRLPNTLEEAENYAYCRPQKKHGIENTSFDAKE